MDLLAKIKQLFAPKKGGGKTKKLPRIVVEKRFDLIGRTGQGSMSKVWRARDKQTGKTICLKVLDKVKTEKFDSRFTNLTRPSEGEILTILKHDNIVKAYEHGLTNKGEQYIMMELIEGVGMNFIVETRSKQMEGNRVHFLSQIAAGLDFMHKKDLLHRDICPRNIMVTEDNVVKLIDFGLSIPNKPDFCRPGNRTGTSDYLAPELIKRVTTDHRVDLFALGVTAYEMFTGALPWDKSDSMTVLQSHLNTAGRDPREHKRDLDKRTTAFLIKAIERDPTRRFQSASEFGAALRTLPKA